MSAAYSVIQEGPVHRLVQHGVAEARIVAAEGNNVTHFRVTIAGRAEAVDVFLPPPAGQGLGPGGYGAGNPILFPFPNRVKGGRYTFLGTTYQLDVNETARGNHIHGLVSKRPWQVEGSGASDQEGAWQRASIRLDAFEDVVRQYPFPCRLTVLTRLKDGVLSQEIAVQNTGPTPLPMGFGTHPWFPAALDGASRGTTLVRVPGRRYWELEQLVPTGRSIPVQSGDGRYDLREWPPLDDLDLDDVFTDLERRADNWSWAGIRYPNARLEIVVEASPEFREWVIYAPASRPVICLEPYTGTTNAVNLEPQGIDAGLIVLGAGATWTGTIRTLLRSL